MSETREPTTRLYRSRQERMIAGVAGGIAQYFNVDPTWVRLAFVILALASGIGVIIYIALAIIMPERPADVPEPPITGNTEVRGGREVLGFILVALGLLFLAGNLGFFRIFRWDYIWPLILIGAGVLLLWRRGRG